MLFKSGSPCFVICFSICLGNGTGIRAQLLGGGAGAVQVRFSATRTVVMTVFFFWNLFCNLFFNLFWEWNWYPRSASARRCWCYSSQVLRNKDCRYDSLFF